QHRFGVAQRVRLRGKGDGAPHLLVMTATPIPRTMALTIYGDLDVTTLDELPPGRTPPRTRICHGARGRAQIVGFLKRKLAEGARAFVVCPLVEPSYEPGADWAAATTTAAHLGESLGPVRVRRVRGRGPARERAAQVRGRHRRPRGAAGHGGRGRRPRGEGDGRPRGGPLRPGAAPPAARAGRARRRRGVLPPAHARVAGERAPGDPRRHLRRVSHRRGGSRAARTGRGPRRAAGGPAQA